MPCFLSLVLIPSTSGIEQPLHCLSKVLVCQDVPGADGVWPVWFRGWSQCHRHAFRVYWAAGKREEQKLLTENIQSEWVTMEGTQWVLSFALVASSEMPRDLGQSESRVTLRQDDAVINVKLLTV